MERGKDDREDKDNLLDSLHHLLSCKRMVRTAQAINSKFERYHQLGYRHGGQLFIRNFIEMARTEKRIIQTATFAPVSCRRLATDFRKSFT